MKTKTATPLTFGQKLKAAREHHHWSLADVAYRLRSVEAGHVSVATLSRWEAMTDEQALTIQDLTLVAVLSALYGMTLSELHTGLAERFERALTYVRAAYSTSSLGSSSLTWDLGCSGGDLATRPRELAGVG